MNVDELRAIMNHLREQVQLEETDEEGTAVVRFRTPALEEMVEAGLSEEGCRQILGSPWWDEMVTDILETPEMCEPEDQAEQVLEYARDVVSEYVRKRASL
jgi:hypothetical protein